MSLMASLDFQGATSIAVMIAVLRSGGRIASRVRMRQIFLWTGADRLELQIMLHHGMGNGPSVMNAIEGFSVDHRVFSPFQDGRKGHQLNAIAATVVTAVTAVGVIVAVFDLLFNNLKSDFSFGL